MTHQLSINEENSHLVAEYLFYSCIKGLQFGLVAGCTSGYIISLSDYLKSIGNRPFDWKRITKFMKRLALIGVLIGLGSASIGIPKLILKNKDFQSNTKITFMDHLTILGMILGGAYQKKEKINGCLVGGLMGFSIGVIVYGFGSLVLRLSKKIRFII